MSRKAFPCLLRTTANMEGNTQKKKIMNIKYIKSRTITSTYIIMKLLPYIMWFKYVTKNMEGTEKQILFLVQI